MSIEVNTGTQVSEGLRQTECVSVEWIPLRLKTNGDLSKIAF